MSLAHKTAKAVIPGFESGMRKRRQASLCDIDPVRFISNIKMLIMRLCTAAAEYFTVG